MRNYNPNLIVPTCAALILHDFDCPANDKSASFAKAKNLFKGGL